MGFEFAGLSLVQVLAVAAAVGTAVVGLYLLKLRRREVAVPFVHLWREVLADERTTRLFSWLKRLLSLLLALLVVAALALALGDPRRAGALRDGRSLVLLVDASASMQATDVPPSRFEEARSRAQEIVDSLGPSDRALVARMEASTVPLSPLTSDVSVLRAALEELRPTETRADFGRALRLALDVLRDQPHAEIVVLSDGRLGQAHDGEGPIDLGDARLSFVPIGKSRRNVAITGFSVRRYPLDKARSEVLLELTSASDRDEEVELTLLGDGRVLDVQRLRLGPGERLARFFEDLAGADRTLEARLGLADGTRDDCPADDHAYARVPERRRARILAVSRGNLYLAAALLLDEYLDVTEVAPDAYDAAAAGRFDVVIFDAWTPPSAPGTAAIYLAPDPAAGAGYAPLDVRGTIPRPFFERVDRRSPFVRWTALGDVNVAEALLVTPRREDRVVASDARGPLMVTGARDGHPFLALTFDVRRSDLPLRVAWPLVLLNAIDAFVEERTGYLASYRTGTTWSVPVPAGATTARVVSPDGEARDAPIVEGRALFAGTRAGFHRVITDRGEESFAASLVDAEEADIAPARGIGVGARRAGRPSGSRAGLRATLWPYLVLAVLAWLVVEWLTYHRRWTV
jgi:hypothetical protein